MEIRDFNKIVIVSLCDSYSKNLGNILSQNLGMMFCDAKDLVEYELIDKNALEKFCTKEYLFECEKRVMNHIASFVNVVVSINYDYLIHHFKTIGKGSLIVFLKLTKKFIKENGNPVDFISYQNRTEDLEKMADLTLNIKKTDTNFVMEKVFEKLGGII